MTFFLDARSASWSRICAALLEFRAWREGNGGYCYIRSPARLHAEIARLCAYLDLEDSCSFAEEPADREACWIDGAKPWRLPAAS